MKQYGALCLLTLTSEIILRSSRPEMFRKIRVLEILQNSQEFFNKVAAKLIDYL